MTDNAEKVEKIVRLTGFKMTDRGGKRLFEGIASSSALDRQGDVLEPAGAQWKLPLPLLLSHDHTKPVGQVYSLERTARGLKFKARIHDFAETGKARDDCNEAWDSVKGGLRRHVSVGFQGLEWEPIHSTGGRRYKAWEVLELSIVVVAANVEARITDHKEYHGVLKLDPKYFPRPKSETPPIKPDPEALKAAELSRIGARLKEIRRLTAGLRRREATNWHPNNQSQLLVIQKTIGDLQKERASLLERDEGLRAGVIDITEKTASAPAGAVTMEQVQAAIRKALAAESKIFAAAVGRALGQTVKELRAEIETRGVRYRGTFQKSDSYTRGDLATFDGSVWHAVRTTSQIPGTNDDWQLAVKRGRDGKDLTR